MKYLAFTLSFYFLSLIATPAVGNLYAKFSSEKCGKSCSKTTDPKNKKDNCKEQTCSSFTCCFKLNILVSSVFKQGNTITKVVAKNNFDLNQLYFLQRNFDIWHPPKFCI